MLLLNNQSGGNLSANSNSKENLDTKDQVVQDAMNLSFKSGVDNVSKSPEPEPVKDDEQIKEDEEPKEADNAYPEPNKGDQKDLLSEELQADSPLNISQMSQVQQILYKKRSN